MNTITSKLGSLVTSDFIKALAVAIFSPIAAYVIVILQAFVDGGSLAIDWSYLIKIGVSAGLGYLVKNFFSSTTVTPVSVPTPIGNVVPMVNVQEKVLGVTVQNSSSASAVMPTQSVPPSIN